MAGPGLDTQVLFKGRLFTDTDVVLKSSIRTHTGKLAKETAKRIRQRLDVVLRNPTGFYRSNIKTATIGGLHNVTDSGVIYGAWLEGIGSRNFPATSFKGYATFRIIQRMIERDAEKITRTETAAMVREMNR